MERIPIYSRDGLAPQMSIVSAFTRIIKTIIRIELRFARFARRLVARRSSAFRIYPSRGVERRFVVERFRDIALRNLDGDIFERWKIDTRPTISRAIRQRFRRSLNILSRIMSANNNLSLYSLTKIKIYIYIYLLFSRKKRKVSLYLQIREIKISQSKRSKFFVAANRNSRLSFVLWEKRTWFPTKWFVDYKKRKKGSQHLLFRSSWWRSISLAESRVLVFKDFQILRKVARAVSPGISPEGAIFFLFILSLFSFSTSPRNLSPRHKSNWCRYRCSVINASLLCFFPPRVWRSIFYARNTNREYEEPRCSRPRNKSPHL